MKCSIERTLSSIAITDRALKLGLRSAARHLRHSRCERRGVANTHEAMIKQAVVGSGSAEIGARCSLMMYKSLLRLMMPNAVADRPPQCGRAAAVAHGGLCAPGSGAACGSRYSVLTEAAGADSVSHMRYGRLAFKQPPNCSWFEVNGSFVASEMGSPISTFRWVAGGGRAVASVTIWCARRTRDYLLRRRPHDGERRRCSAAGLKVSGGGGEREERKKERKNKRKNQKTPTPPPPHPPHWGSYRARQCRGFLRTIEQGCRDAHAIPGICRQTAERAHHRNVCADSVPKRRCRPPAASRRGGPNAVGRRDSASEAFRRPDALGYTAPKGPAC